MLFIKVLLDRLCRILEDRLGQRIHSKTFRNIVHAVHNEVGSVPVGQTLLDLIISLVVHATISR